MLNIKMWKGQMLMNNVPMEIAYCEFIFENCDSLKIYPEEIDKWKMNFSKEIDMKKKSISKGVISYFTMIINENRDYISFEVSDEHIPNFDKISIYYRISWNDIAQIKITYSNGDIECFYVDWSDTTEINDYQKTEIIDG